MAFCEFCGQQVPFGLAGCLNAAKLGNGGGGWKIIMEYSDSLDLEYLI